MYRFYRLLVLLAAIAVVMVLVSACDQSESDNGSETTRAVSWGIKGFNYPSWWHDDYLSAQSAGSLDRLAATGANWVAVIPTQYMDGIDASSIAPEYAGRSATDESVVRAIEDARGRGLKVMLKPHIDVIDNTWRGDIQPDDPDAWFSDYRTMIIVYARLAEEHDVELLCVGTELASMESSEYHDRWVDIIADVRAVYGGELTYGASINSYENITFWDGLDYLGLSFYYPLSDDASPSQEDLVDGWTQYNGFYSEEGSNWLGRIETWQEEWQKPVIFTEIGYRSIEYAARTPWDFDSTGLYDDAVQARAYEAVFQVMNNKPWFSGLFWWNWGVRDDTCGPGNTDYTICGKEAESVAQRMFSGDPS